jgi:EpsI family protein
MTKRVTLVVVTLLMCATLSLWLSQPEAAPRRLPLSSLQMRIGEWSGREAPLEEKVVRVLGVSDFVNRYYGTRTRPTVSLYIGYYESQRTGETIHSPMKCLPGTGWQPLETGERVVTVPTAAGNRELSVNRYLVQKGSSKLVVYFWYQLQDRITTSEYMAKVLLVEGALIANRTDGALVRVIAPLREGGTADEADKAAVDFIRALFPLLPTHLPA